MTLGALLQDKYYPQHKHFMRLCKYNDTHLNYKHRAASYFLLREKKEEEWGEWKFLSYGNEFGQPLATYSRELVFM